MAWDGQKIDLPKEKLNWIWRKAKVEEWTALFFHSLFLSFSLCTAGNKGISWWRLVTPVQEKKRFLYYCSERGKRWKIPSVTIARKIPGFVEVKKPVESTLKYGDLFTFPYLYPTEGWTLHLWNWLQQCQSLVLALSSGAWNLNLTLLM